VRRLIAQPIAVGVITADFVGYRGIHGNIPKNTSSRLKAGSGMILNDWSRAVQEICLVNIRVYTVVKIIILKSLFGLLTISSYINVPVCSIVPKIKIKIHTAETEIFVDPFELTHRYLLAPARTDVIRLPYTTMITLCLWRARAGGRIILLLIQPAQFAHQGGHGLFCNGFFCILVNLIEICIRITQGILNDFQFFFSQHSSIPYC
jgi:hypothetical protein